MSILDEVGSVLNKVKGWAVDSLKPVADTVKKVGSWMHDVGKISEAYLEGKEIKFDDSDKCTERRVADNSRPNFYNNEDFDQKETVLVKIEENKRNLIDIKNQGLERYNKLQLQIEVTELIVASQVFQRFAANIALHQSNLKIHHQTIQNTSGMLDDINRQRLGVKALIYQVNKIILALDEKGLNTTDFKKISNIELDPKYGAISIRGAYFHFEETRGLLEQEISDFLDLLDTQESRAKQVLSLAQSVPEKAYEVSNWLETKVLPELKGARKKTQGILRAVKHIPKLEEVSKKELSEITDK